MIYLNKRYSIIGILIIIGLVVAISGCTSQNTSTNKSSPPYPSYNVGSSTFELSPDWKNPKSSENVDQTANITQLAYNGGEELYIYVKQFSDENAFNSEYKISKTTPNSEIKTLNISGISVKYTQIGFIMTDQSDLAGSRVTTDYFFQKNENYYDIAFEDYRTNNSDQSMIKEAVNTVIGSLN